MEQLERKNRQLEGEKEDLHKKVEEMTKQYNDIKAELASTLKGLEEL